MNPSPAPKSTRDWPVAAALFFAALAALLLAYHDTVASLIRVWSHSDTYAHGFLVAPICGLLVWQKRSELAALAPRPWPPGFLLFLPLGALWLVGRATDTQAFQHLGFVAMVPALVIAILGPAVARALAFPLCFLAFAIPFGDAIQESLMDFTAAFAVRALRICGVPVVREGLYLSTPVAQWRVVDGCSGLRFVISGFALSCLFAYWNYRSAWKRVAFSLLSIVALILANGFRAYALILMGYLSHLRWGVGVGHIVFGWVVFAAVMVAFFAWGISLRDRPADPEDHDGTRAAASSDTVAARPRPATNAPWVATGIAALAAVLVWPGLFAARSATRVAVPAAEVPVPEPRGGWSAAPDSSPAWAPGFRGEATRTSAVYTKNASLVRCTIAFYDRPEPGRGLVQSQGGIVAADDSTWRNYGEQNRSIPAEGSTLSLRETRLAARSERLVVWHWFWLPDAFTSSRVRAKLLEARASLLLGRDRGAVIVVSTPDSAPGEAERRLQTFVDAMLPSIRSSLRTADAPR